MIMDRKTIRIVGIIVAIVTILGMVVFLLVPLFS